MTRTRTWGFWTRLKLEMLRRYLSAFTMASKKARSTTYLDLFAGQSDNRDRRTGQRLEGSPGIALSTTPEFSRSIFFELEHANDLRTSLASRFDTRRFSVVEGDCNDQLGAVLSSGVVPRRDPAFTFIDPNGPDCWWTTLRDLADYKTGPYKIELWMLFPVDMFTRFLRVDGGTVRPEDSRRISKVFGTDEWQRIYDGRLRGALDATEARARYVNLMRWRLQRDLGYARTHSFDFLNSKRSMYSMIFATDHFAGDKIMGSIYEWAGGELPNQVEEARRQRSAQGSLFIPSEPLSYEHAEPDRPFDDL